MRGIRQWWRDMKCQDELVIQALTRLILAPHIQIARVNSIRLCRFVLVRLDDESERIVDIDSHQRSVFRFLAANWFISNVPDQAEIHRLAELEKPVLKLAEQWKDHSEYPLRR